MAGDLECGRLDTRPCTRHDHPRIRTPVSGVSQEAAKDEQEGGQKTAKNVAQGRKETAESNEEISEIATKIRRQGETSLDCPVSRSVSVTFRK